MVYDREDARVPLARRILFSHKAIRGLQLNPQDKIRHETIHRMWLLFQNRRRRSRLTRLELLEKSISKTMKVLRETDEQLYNRAVAGARDEEKRFPLVMRIPTDTMPLNYWNYGWTNENIRGIGGVVKPG